MIIVVCLVTGNKIYKFCLGSISKEFEYVDAEEVSLKGNVYHFSVDYDAIDTSDILNIHNG